MHAVNDVRWPERHTTEQQVTDPNALEFELAIGKLKSHTSSGIDKILTELIVAEGRTIRHEIHKIVISLWNKEELPEEWKESILVPLYKKGDKRDCSNYRACHF